MNDVGSIEQSWNICTVPLPEAERWTVLDLAAPDPGLWARTAASERLGPECPAEWVDAFADDLRWYTKAALGREAIAAAVLQPGHRESIAAFQYVAELAVPEQSRRIDLLAARAKTPDGVVFRAPEVTEVSLPLGPAVRSHTFEPAAPEAGSSAVIESVVHYVLPERYPDTVLEIVMIWDSPAYGELFAGFADQAAAGVSLAWSAGARGSAAPERAAAEDKSQRHVAEDQQDQRHEEHRACR